MKTRISVLIIFALGFAASLFYPAIEMFLENNSDKPVYTSYDEFMNRILPEAISKNAKRHKCGGYLVTVKNAEGDISKTRNIIPDVNFALIRNYKGWQLDVDQKTAEQMKKRDEKKFSKWASMDVSSQMIKEIRGRKKKDFDTNWSARLMVSVLQDKKINNIEVFLYIDDESRHSNLFQMSGKFTSPDREIALLKDYKDRVDRLKKIKKRAKAGNLAAVILSFVFAAFILFEFTRVIITRKQKKAYREYLLAEINKFKELFSNGHYVTACELLENYLAEFPHDTGIRASHKRLLDYTGNDPAKAQAAFVEHKKLMARMKNGNRASGAMLLTEAEKQAITPLLSYHPELKSSYNEALALDDTMVKQKEQEARENLKKVYASLLRRDMNMAQNALASVLQTSGQTDAASSLEKKLKNPAGTSFKFTADNHYPDFEIHAKQALNIGRFDENSWPDVLYEDRRISRKHMTISLYDQRVTALDHGSSAGSFLNGDPVTGYSATLNTGDIITLGKKFDLEVTIIPDPNTGTPGGVLLKGKDKNIILIFSELSFILAEAGLLTEIRDAGGAVRVLLVQDILVMSARDNTFIPGNHESVAINGQWYKTEVIK